MTRPVLLIGLDGAAWDVLDPLIAAGDLPTLAGLMERGAHGTLRSVVPPITPAAWSSFMTGKRPGKHGIYDFRVYDPRAYRDAFVTSRSLREPTMWELLTAAGRRVAVVNLPVMYPPPAAAGTVVSGFDTPSTEAEFARPPELRRHILERIPDYGFVATADPADPGLEQDSTFEAFVSAVERGFAQRTRVALDLLADGPWDVFMVHHQDTDALQHRVWRFLADPARHPARWARLRQTYRQLDTHLASVLAAAPGDALVLVVSDHGFGAQQGRVFPNVLLRRWGHLRERGRWRARLARSVRKRLVQFGLARPQSKAAAAWEVRVRERSFAHVLALDWRRTRAYLAVAEIYGLLYVNLRGREPEGIVAPGREQEALLETLRAELLAVRDPRDGAPVFAEVLRGEDVYPVDAHGRRPDLVLVARPEYTIYRDLNSRLWIDHYRLTSGTHRPEGVLVAAGDGVRPGRLADAVEIVDVAPTVLAAAGVAIPDDVDGRVLAELFVDPPVARWVPASVRPPDTAPALTEAEEAQVTERLRALGYLA